MSGNILIEVHSELFVPLGIVRGTKGIKGMDILFQRITNAQHQQLEALKAQGMLCLQKVPSPASHLEQQHWKRTPAQDPRAPLQIRVDNTGLDSQWPGSEESSFIIYSASNLFQHRPFFYISAGFLQHMWFGKAHS